MAARAYQVSSTRRSQREQDADVFRRANAALRAANQNDPISRARALADNQQLWTMVVDLLRDPANPLPDELRGSIISVGLAVKRELAAPEPDFSFLIHINEQIAAGLTGAH